jgi:hypothetical protein
MLGTTNARPYCTDDIRQVAGGLLLTRGKVTGDGRVVDGTACLHTCTHEASTLECKHAPNGPVGNSRQSSSSIPIHGGPRAHHDRIGGRAGNRRHAYAPLPRRTLTYTIAIASLSSPEGGLYFAIDVLKNDGLSRRIYGIRLVGDADNLAVMPSDFLEVPIVGLVQGGVGRISGIEIQVAKIVGTII